MEIIDPRVQLQKMSYGYTEGFDTIEFDNRLVEIYELLKHLTSIGAFCQTNSKCLNMDNEIEKNKKVFDRFNLKIDKIPYMNDYYISYFNNEKYLEISKILDKISYVFPYDIIKQTESNDYYCVNITTFKINNSFDERLIIIPCIQVPLQANEFSLGFISHEIVHTQLFKTKGSMKYFYNGELLSIFFELITNYEQDNLLYQRQIKKRLELFYIELKINSAIVYNKYKGDYYSYITTLKYIISTLEAFNLLDKYIEGNSQEKEYIIRTIQDIFDGKCTLEDLLIELDITKDNSMNKEIISKHI